MQLKMTEWEFSNQTAQSDVPLSAGHHHLYIEEATYFPDNKVYQIRIRSLDTDEVSTIKYFMANSDMSKNNKAIGTLNTLKKALAGEGDGVLAPCDIIHGIVEAEVVMSKPKSYNGEMRQFPNIYEYKPVSKDFYDLSKESGVEVIDQYVEE